ncbi:hypothetical protein RFI_22008 [Reticulomyxa filosa]|uniref:Uncharacterized protein n=1 Tax=Reticulomyxa filosa TaxID=46433 RepID=X6MNX7_RETFI|nr:hypothetical protein RFI_22008 [Reticulomyxa filosa]|eukprot:ETO15356.1 hypothetical protein RFI_22008 [Reticulomyxa filosa]
MSDSKVVQTIPTISKSVSSQTDNEKNQWTQTETSEEILRQTHPTLQFNENNLVKFLKQIQPQILHELEQTLAIELKGVFKHYYADWKDHSNSKTYVKRTIHCNKDFNSKKLTQSIEATPKSTDTISFSCNSVSINCKSNLLAVGHGVEGHQNYCSHSSSISLYNLRTLERESQRELPSCVTVLQFHPVERDILSVGLFNGCIYIYKLYQEEQGDPTEQERYKSSNSNECYHHEPITDIQWVNNYSDSNLKLVSVSLDGKILLWNVTKDKMQYPELGYRLQPNRIYFGHSLSNRTYIPELSTATAVNISITKVAFPNCQWGRFILATQGTFILFYFILQIYLYYLLFLIFFFFFFPPPSKKRGGVLSCLDTSDTTTENKDAQEDRTIKKDGIIWAAAAYRLYKNIGCAKNALQVLRKIEKYKNTNNDLDMKTKENTALTLQDIFLSQCSAEEIYPCTDIKLSYTKHIGFVTALECSPFNQNVFLSTSKDGILRVFSLLQMKPVFEIHVRFFFFWRCLFACIIVSVFAPSQTTNALCISPSIKLPVLEMQNGQLLNQLLFPALRDFT